MKTPGKSLAVAFIMVMIVGSACEPQSKSNGEPIETALEGTAEILCDEEVFNLMQASKELYDKLHPKADVTIRAVSAQEASAELLAHEARGIVIARGWSQAEDSVAKKIKGEDGYPRTQIARDALVFYAGKGFPLDTLNSEDIKAWLLGGEVDPDIYPELPRKPTFIVPGSQSSVYSNVSIVALGGLQPGPNALTSLGHKDSVVQHVMTSRTDIGIGYLSQFVNDDRVKLLRLSYVDKDGLYERPKPVHAAYLIMGKYPFPVPIYIVLRDRAHKYSLPSGYMLYIARDAAAQRTFFDAGIEPAYAKFELLLPE